MTVPLHQRWQRLPATTELAGHHLWQWITHEASGVCVYEEERERKDPYFKQHSSCVSQGYILSL